MSSAIFAQSALTSAASRGNHASPPVTCAIRFKTPGLLSASFSPKIPIAKTITFDRLACASTSLKVMRLALSPTVADYDQYFLVPLGAAHAFITCGDRVVERCPAGVRPREDGFFKIRGTGREHLASGHAGVNALVEIQCEKLIAGVALARELHCPGDTGRPLRSHAAARIHNQAGRHRLVLRAEDL